MLYHLYELMHAALNPTRIVAGSARFNLGNPFNPLTHTTMGRSIAAAAELVERTTRRYRKPEFGITETIVSGKTVAVRETVVWEMPFCRLVHFSRDLPARESLRSTRILVVAPMSGHYATLLRGSIQGLLPFHEVYVTDWADARMVPTDCEAFGLDDYVDYLVTMIRLFRGDVHVMAVVSLPCLSLWQSPTSKQSKIRIYRVVCCSLVDRSIRESARPP